MEHIKYPSTEQFKNIVSNVNKSYSYRGKDENGEPIYEKHAKLPTITFSVTNKIHGSNCSFNYNLFTDEMIYQSRERVLSLGFDVYNFMETFLPNDAIVKGMIKNIHEYIRDNGLDGGGDFTNIVMYGEWFGHGINNKAAVCTIPSKQYAIFSIVLVTVEGYRLPIDISLLPQELIINEELKIYNVLQFGHTTIDIDFERPQEAQNTLVRMTQEVEDNCPVGRYFGIDGGVGEGIVLTFYPKPKESYRNYLLFKCKGDKHSSSKVKVIAEVDEAKLKNEQEFLDTVLTESRLEQGYEYIKVELGLEQDMKSIGAFLSFIFRDIVKEESALMEANGISQKTIGGKVSYQAKRWYIDKINTF